MKRLRVVLYRSIYPRNVGMCARAMANMGLEHLILVEPQCELGIEARQGAANAQTVLANTVIYKSHAEFLAHEGEGVRIALSGRQKNRLREPDVLDHLLASLADEPDHLIHQPDTTVYLIFGTEDDGLSDAEMDLCNFICKLPTFGEITSLNLSHAVLLATYITRTSLMSDEVSHELNGFTGKMGLDGGSQPAHLRTHDSAHSSLDSQLGTNNTAATISGRSTNCNTQPSPTPLSYPTHVIRAWLEALGFDISAPKVNIEKTMNRILLSRSPSSEELRILNTVLHQTVNKLKSK